MDATKNIDNEFANGSGLINPRNAVEPGLIYKITPSDYIRMLCSEGWKAKEYKLISNNEWSRQFF